MSKNLIISTITNEEYKTMQNVHITYGFVDSQFGPCIIGIIDKQLCHIAFFDEGKDNVAIDILQNEWPKAILKENNNVIEEIAKNIFEDYKENDKELNVLLKGTNYQITIWKELVKIKSGVTTTYEDIAKAIGKRKAIRAVANAIARNRIAYIIPCHRIIPKSGDIGKYRWGIQRKKKMLKLEKAL